MNRLLYLIIGVAAVSLATGCAERLSADPTGSSDRQIVISSQMEDRFQSSKAPMLPNSDLTRVQFLRKDAATPPSNFSGILPISGDRNGTTGDITFGTPPTYGLDDSPAYFSAYCPAGALVSNVVTWAIDGKTDILLTKTVYDAGKYSAPKTGKGGDAGLPMAFNHLLAQLEVVCKAESTSGVAQAAVQYTWGKVTKVELLETATELKYRLADHSVAQGAKGAKVLWGSYDVAFPAAGLDLLTEPNPSVTAVGMFASGAGVEPIKLRITTEKGGAIEVPVQLQSGSTNKGFEAGFRHTVTLVFKAAEQKIVVEGTKIAEWKDGYVASTEVGVPPLYVEINGLRWATGNLVAANGGAGAQGAGGCKIGKPDDAGLYFQFGSLIGYKGGSEASGGTGEGWVGYTSGYWGGATSFSFANEAMVWPVEMVGNPGSVWPTGKSTNEWYFGHKGAPYATSGTDIRSYAGYTDGSLASKGVGDPCTYYLGGTWRQATTQEFQSLYNAGWSGAGWKTLNKSTGSYFGPAAAAENLSTSLFFPATGCRISNGTLTSIGVYCDYWTSVIAHSANGFYFSFTSTAPNKNTSFGRDTGQPVRCVSAVVNSPKPDEYVQINGLKWAKGNLVATNSSGCKVGKPEDGGLYFQFGSLIGYKGGSIASGGTGEGWVGASLNSWWGGAVSFSFANDAMVWPVGMEGNPGSIWPQDKSANEWYFGHNAAPYNQAGTDIRSYPGFVQGALASKGVGDPCTYYLGTPWRQATAQEFQTLYDAGWSGSGWKTLNGSTGHYFGPNAAASNLSTSLFFPVVGCRNVPGGAFASIGTAGDYWSSSVFNAVNGHYFTFASNNVKPQSNIIRGIAAPARCVSGTYVPPPVVNPPAESDYVTVGSLKWTKGNLVAKNGNECKVGAATDDGLYFHFGSLVGWTGGANGDGTGTGTGTGTGRPEPAVQVRSQSYSGSTSWPAGYYQGGTTDTKGYDLPTTDAPTTGIGDPCRYYLGGTWRTPTAAEWLALIGDFGANTNKGVPLTVNNTALSFPASGNRDASGGTFNYVGSGGRYWSSSVDNATYGYYLNFYSGYVNPQFGNNRSYGMPVRCVAPLVARLPECPVSVPLRGTETYPAERTMVLGALKGPDRRGAKEIVG